MAAAIAILIAIAHRPSGFAVYSIYKRDHEELIKIKGRRVIPHTYRKIRKAWKI
jgi:hypothetical protein